MTGLDELNTMLGGMGTAPAATPAAPPAASAPETVPATPAQPAAAAPATTPETAPAAAAPTAAPAAAPAVPDTTETPEQIFNGSKQNQAFAQMRTQNKTLLNTIAKFGQVLGLQEITDPEKLVPALEQKLMEYEAKQANIPVNYLQQMEQSRQAQMRMEQEQFRTQATLGFQKVKDTFGLDNNALVAFAQQLSAQGLDPYQQPVDLIAAYRTLNFEKILEQSNNKAVQEALARQKKAENQGSTPSTAVGKPPDNSTPVNTVAGLNQILAGMGNR